MTPRDPNPDTKPDRGQDRGQDTDQGTKPAPETGLESGSKTGSKTGRPGQYETLADLPARLPLFPLPGALLFAREILPLNIFEPRYVAMIDHILAHDRMIGIIQPVDEEPDGDHPTLQGVGCAARLVSFQETTDSRYLISLRGICRFDLGEEQPPGEGGFRIAEVNYARFGHDLKPSEDAGRINRKGLLDIVKEYLTRNNMDANWDVIHQTPDESLINYLCMVSPFGPRERQALLETETLVDRTDMMIALAEMLLARGDNDETPIH